jgi:hypothetical protein
MRPSILTSAVVAALLPTLPLSAAAQADTPAPAAATKARAKPKPKPKPRKKTPRRRGPPAAPRRDPRYSVSGTITVAATVRTRCAGLGGKGEITETATTFSEYAVSGSGAPGGRGTLTTRLRRRVVLDKQVVDVEYAKPSHVESSWTTSGTSTSQFGKTISLSDGQLVGDLGTAIGERRRVKRLRPAPGATADLSFGGMPVREEYEPSSGCFESYAETQVTGTLTVTNED